MRKAISTLLFIAVMLSFVFLSQSTVVAADLTVAISSQALATTPDDGGGSCAAAYVLGSDDPQLDTLRAFRDNVLAKSPTGQQLIKMYYTQNDKIIALLESSPAFKKSAKNILVAIAPAIDTLLGKK